MSLFPVGPNSICIRKPCAISNLIGHNLKYFLYKYGSPSNMWQSLVTIGREISEIRRRKKNRKNGRKIETYQQQNIMATSIAAGGHSNNDDKLFMGIRLRAVQCKSRSI